MSNKSLRIVLFILSLMLFTTVCACANAPTPETTAPVTTPVSTTVPTAVATTEPTTAPTTEPTTVPTTQPVAREFLLSFVGDCVLGNHKGTVSDNSFCGIVGDNYNYPWLYSLAYFENDDCTFVNLESVLTESEEYAPKKKFVFKGPTAYKNILTAGSVEFANIVNNHTLDYLEQGYQDTIAALDSVGIHYAHKQSTRLFTTESGLTIGVYSDQFAMNIDGLTKYNAGKECEKFIETMVPKIKQLRQDGAEVIVAAMHFGEEYWYKPNKYQKQIARAAIDAGANIVWGHHPHVLQPVEEYNGGIIYYSLGNFAFGGNNFPVDKDSVIMRQTIIREADGTIRLGELNMIPFSVSSVRSGTNYQPAPRVLDSEEYNRAMQKLTGKYPLTHRVPSYREDIGGIKPTEPTETIPATTPGTPAETVPSVTEPAPPATEPAPSTTEPAPPTTEPAPPTTEPAPPTTEPAPPTTAPAPPTTEPAPPTTEPAPPTEAPAPPTEAPAPPAETALPSNEGGESA